MKNINLISMLIILLVFVNACKKSDNSSTNINDQPPANAISKDTLKGFIKGTMVKMKTYYLNGDVYIKSTDTLALQEGVTVKALGNYGIYVSGTMISNGTSVHPNMFTTANANPILGTGYWGGIQCDSLSKYINIQWTKIFYTGGPDQSGSPQFSFSVVGVSSTGFTSNTTLIFENNWLYGGQDDGMRLTGPIKVSVKGNSFQHMGSEDGETINVKKGVTGDVAYNYIWSAANNGIKFETNSDVLFPQTIVNVYNNTVINGGFRKTGEPTSGILVDKFARVALYNNIFVGNHTGIRITKKADTTGILGKYGNNLICATSDTLSAYYYPAGDWGKQQASDVILSASPSNCSSVFVSYDPNVNATVDNNNCHLNASSPALNKGNATAPYTAGLGAAMKPSKDLGAFPSDGSGNKH